MSRKIEYQLSKVKEGNGKVLYTSTGDELAAMPASMTGLPIEEVKHYIDLCQEGDSTIPERAELIFKQEKSLRNQLRVLKKQMEVLKYKKKFYQDLLENRRPDSCNPLNHAPANEPNITPED